MLQPVAEVVSNHVVAVPIVGTPARAVYTAIISDKLHFSTWKSVKVGPYGCWREDRICLSSLAGAGDGSRYAVSCPASSRMTRVEKCIYRI